MPYQALSLLLAMFVGAAPSAPAPAYVAPPRVARLEFTLTTSAPVTVVRLSPGTVLADRIESRTPGLQVESGPTGWTIRGGKRAGSAIRVRAVFEELTNASRFGVRLRTAGPGTASVRVTNVSAKPFKVGSLVASSGLAGSLSINRLRLFGRTEPAAVRPDPRKLVLAAYYPWYGSNYGSPKFSDRPSDPRSTREADGVLSMTKQAAAADIDGFVVSWAGAKNNGGGLDLALDAAEKVGTMVSVYLATPAANTQGSFGAPVEQAVVARWLAEALQKASSPAFLRSGGVPVVFVYQMNALKPAGWAWVLDRLRVHGLAVRLVGDAGMNSFGKSEWGYHQYGTQAFRPDGLRAWNRASAAEARLLADPSKLFVATVSPGYDDRPARGSAGTYVGREAGERYSSTWDAALASSPDWILVTSWNEWFEGTAVEPGTASGDLALRQTAEYVARFKG